MKKTESEIQREIIVAGNRGGMRLFRNNIAKIQHRGRWLSFGIPGKGGADLIGWTTQTVTPEMVGKKLAVFTSVEVKTPTGRASKEQENWLKQVNNAGGIAKIIRDKNEL